jgi:hypothetical protein
LSQCKNIQIAPCKTHHLNSNQEPIYQERFYTVLAFHAVDNVLIAPVIRNGEAWHIDIHGQAIYANRYQRTFGFYCGYAASILEGKWTHINIKGDPIYAERYSFAGNFQQNLSVVCDDKGQYFHINTEGTPINQQRWRYCGDFHEGYAVVQDERGLSTHIDQQGNFLHPHWFEDLDVFHKGYARAKSANAWYHINQKGLPIYPQRHALIEPFYNGFARCESFYGERFIIDETGHKVRQLREANNDFSVIRFEKK